MASFKILKQDFCFLMFFKKLVIAIVITRKLKQNNIIFPILYDTAEY